MSRRWIASAVLASALALTSGRDMSAQDVPRMPDGKPDFSGMYTQPATVNGTGPRGNLIFNADKMAPVKPGAESLLYRQWGADVIGMTALPEARLAREAELPYALLGMVTDYDAWRDADAGVEAAEILAVVRANAETARRALAELAKALPEERAPSAIDRALDAALITPRSAWNRAAVARLDAVMGRLLREGFARRMSKGEG